MADEIAEVARYTFRVEPRPGAQLVVHVRLFGAAGESHGSDPLSLLHGIAHLQADTPLLEVCEQAVLAIAVVDRHIVAVEEPCIFRQRFGREQLAAQILGVAISERDDATAARRVHRRAIAVPILGLLAVGAERTSGGIDNVEIVAIAHEVGLEAELPCERAQIVEPPVMGIEVVSRLDEYPPAQRQHQIGFRLIAHRRDAQLDARFPRRGRCERERIAELVQLQIGRKGMERIEDDHRFPRLQLALRYGEDTGAETATVHRLARGELAVAVVDRHGNRLDAPLLVGCILEHEIEIQLLARAGFDVGSRRLRNDANRRRLGIHRARKEGDDQPGCAQVSRSARSARRAHRSSPWAKCGSARAGIRRSATPRVAAAESISACAPGVSASHGLQTAALPA